MAQHTLMDLAFVLVVGVAAGALSGIIGTGASIVLLPILVYQFGPKEAVPIMAIAALMSNIGKLLAWWREVDWRAFAAYSITGAPAAVLGARTFVALPGHAIDIALGVFFIAMIPFRRWLRSRAFHIGLVPLALAGVLIGFVTGIVLSTGPLSVPVFGAYGLVKGAFLSTEAASSMTLMIAKIATFRELGALPWPSVLRGLTVGSSVLAGAFVGKAVVQRMRVGTFELLLDAMLLVSGVSLLWASVR